jgi:hypothetical protein
MVSRGNEMFANLQRTGSVAQPMAGAIINDVQRRLIRPCWHFKMSLISEMKKNEIMHACTLLK